MFSAIIYRLCIIDKLCTKMWTPCILIDVIKILPKKSMSSKTTSFVQCHMLKLHSG